jgi:hypothetical protein
MLAPGSVLLATPAQASTDSDDDDAPELLIVDGWTHNVPLKAIKDASGNIEEQDDFEIEADEIITVSQNNDFVVVPSFGKIDKVKVSDAQLITTELQFSNIVVKQNLAPKSYLLDVIVSTDNGNKYAYETVLTILAPGQVLTDDNRENIIQSFNTVTVDISIVFRESPSDDNNNPPSEEPSVCYFAPNTDPHCKPVNGVCPEDAPIFNSKGNCHPGGKCPTVDGEPFIRVDDDESGKCFKQSLTFRCPGSNAIVLDKKDCAIYENPILPLDNATGAEENIGESNMTGSDTGSGNESNMTDDENSEVISDVCLPSFGPPPAYCDEGQTPTPAPTEEPTTCEAGFILENGECVETSSNCGGQPCTPSQKEDSWLSSEPESSPGVPINETTDSEESEPEEEPENTEVEDSGNSNNEESEEEGETNSDGDSQLD